MHTFTVKSFEVARTKTVHVARCSCGWTTEPVATRAEAVTDVQWHIGTDHAELAGLPEDIVERIAVLPACQGTRFVAAPTPERPHRSARVPCHKKGIRTIYGATTLHFCTDCFESYEDGRIELAGEGATS